MKLTLNLSRLIKSNESSPVKQKALGKIARDYDTAFEFGNRVIDEIVRRSRENNTDKNDVKFKAYSKEYKKSLQFEVYEKTGAVTMELTGQMLASMSVTNVTGSQVTVGFISGTQEDKAKRHIKGSGRMPKRDFFGLSEAKQYNIFKAIVKEKNA